MRKGNQAWTSRDPIERRDTVRRVVRRLMVDRDLDDAQVARILGVSPQRFNRMMKPGERTFISLGDVLLLSELLGGEDAFLGELAAARGRRLVAEAPAEASGGDVLSATAAVMATASALVTTATEAAANGVTPERARIVTRDGEAVRRAVGRLDAVVSVAVVEPVSPIRRTSER